MNIQFISQANLKLAGIFRLALLLGFAFLAHFESYSQNVDSSKFATVYFIRDKNMQNSLYVMRLKINDSTIVKLKNNSYQKFYFNPSEIKISQMSMHFIPWISDTVNLYAGTSYYFKYFRKKDIDNYYYAHYRKISIYYKTFAQVSDSVGRSSIRLIDLNKKLKSISKQKNKEEFTKVKRNSVAVDRPLSKDSSYIYFMRQNLFYASGVPFKISISDSFSFLLPNNSMYIHATTASEVDIMGMNTNNNFQNTSLHLTLKKGQAYYVYSCLSFENGLTSTTIRLELIDRETYRNKIWKKGEKTIIL